MAVLKYAKQHEPMMQSEKLKKEFDALSKAFEAHTFSFQPGTINLVMMGADYHDFEKKMHLSFALVNEMDRPVCEIHAKLRLKLNVPDVQVALMNMNFDKEFLGELKPDEAVFLTFPVPVRGLEEDRSFSYTEYSGELDDVRVTFADEEASENASD